MKVPKQIIEGCIESDRRAQSQMYKLCFQYLMRVCSRYEKNEEDAVALLNIGFLKILTKISIYNESVPFDMWIRRIMINTIIDEYRKDKKRKEMFENTDFSESEFRLEAVDEILEGMWSREQLKSMIRQLPEKNQVVFNLFEVDGYSHKEIVEMLNISESSSKRYLAQSRQKLAVMLERSESLKAVI